jgi:ribosomal peptide maturation radical SAM protein 1
MADKTVSTRAPSVVLVSLPWTNLNQPSLGLGILHALLTQEGVACRVLHLNLFLLEHLKATTYYALSMEYALNDFLFSGVLDPEVSRKQQQWLRLKTSTLLATGLIDYRKYEGLDGVVEKLLRLRQEVVPTWLARWADEISNSDATLVGMTCMFDQTVASLALAHLVKQRSPEKLIALGGYAVRSPTGEAVMRAFPFIDAICTGEGESAIVPLARASVGEVPLRKVPNILYRSGDESVQATTVAPQVDLNTRPPPNYDDFFADVRSLAEVYRVEVAVQGLPVEDSRGCWWGQKKHCVFCGIHDADMAYRSLEAARLLEVMDELAERYEIKSFRFSGYILPHQYFTTLMPLLVSRGRPYKISCEMKSNITAEKFALLAAAGFDEVQPGIESFSSDVLRKMDKGVSATQNVYTMLLGKRHGIVVHWNLIYGLPDDDVREISAMRQALPRLVHLRAPASRCPIQITRYAPLQADPARFGIPRPVYHPAYDLVFSPDYLRKTGFDLHDFSYYFERPFENSPRLNRLYVEMERIVDAWKCLEAKREVSLWYEEQLDGLNIFDSRTEPSSETRLTPLESTVYRLTNAPIAIGTLRQRCLALMEDAEFDRSLERLDQLSLIFQEGGLVVGLALPKGFSGSSVESAGGVGLP